MSRLIDADALLKRKGCVYDSEGHVLFAVGTGDIVHAPTIDAIPMWWITEKFLDVLNKDKELSKAVWLVRKAWQKEQEAR